MIRSAVQMDSRSLQSLEAYCLNCSLLALYFASFLHESWQLSPISMVIVLWVFAKEVYHVLMGFSIVSLHVDFAADLYKGMIGTAPGHQG
jgi:hypothetical protein